MDSSQKSSGYSGLLRSSIGKHPGATAIAMAVLLVLIVVLSVMVGGARAKCSKSGFEGMASSPCGPGETPVTYKNPDGTTLTYCRSSDVLPGPPTVCGVGWDPAASAEAQALATVGSLQHDSYGERRLQRAVDGAFDSNVGLSDRDLEALMHQGGTP
jgi:hypothetical protein